MNRSGLLTIAFAISVFVPSVALTAGPTTEQKSPGNTQPAPDNQQADKFLAEVLKIRAETEKLEYENTRLKEELSYRPFMRSPWLQLLFAFLGGLFAAGLASGVALYTAYRSRLGTFDQAVLERRLEKFGNLVDATEALALYFPTGALTSAKCHMTGRRLRECYFDGVGILLTTDARDRYFLLMRGLSLAAVANRLNAPTLEEFPQLISENSIGEYRKRLGLQESESDSTEVHQGESSEKSQRDQTKKLQKVVEGWRFGEIVPEVEHDTTTAAANRFRDFVLLQTLSSHLRTALTEALRGRRRPS